MEGDEGLSAFHPFSEERRISGTAGEIISSLHRAGHIFMFGRFIKNIEKGGAQ